MTIKELKSAIADLPDNMPVAIYDGVSETSALPARVWVCNNAMACPYDKADNVYSNAAWYRKKSLPTPIESDDTKVCFLL